MRNKICIFAEIFDDPDLWIFHDQEICPQIGFFPQIGGPQIGESTVF